MRFIYNEKVMGKIVNIDRNGIVNVVFNHEMNHEDIDCFLDELQGAFKGDDIRRRVLCDISNYRKIPDYVDRDKIVKVIKPMKPYTEKAAIFGLDMATRVVASTIFIMAGRSDIKFFETHDEAYKWVTS